MICIEGIDFIILFALALAGLFFAYKLGFRSGHAQGFGSAQNLALQRLVRAQRNVEVVGKGEEWPEDADFREI